MVSSEGRCSSLMIPIMCEKSCFCWLSGDCGLRAIAYMGPESIRSGEVKL